MALVQHKPRDLYQFPGALGRNSRVRTNLFDISITKPGNIGIFEVIGTKLNKKGPPTSFPPNKVFQLFRKVHGGLLQRFQLVEGYPTEHGIMVYTIPNYFKDIPIREDQYRNSVAGEYRGHVNMNEWEQFDNELRRFLKRAALQSIAAMFQKHDYTLMKTCIYTFKVEDTRFPVRPLNNVLQLVSGFKISFKTNVPNKDYPKQSRNMAAINFTQTVTTRTRTNINLFDCYVELCSQGFPINPTPEDFQNLMLDRFSVDLLNRVFENVSVYLPGEEIGNHHVYYKFIEVTDRTAGFYRIENGRRSIVDYWENKLNRRLRYPSLNAVKLKAARDRIIYIPMELVTLSDRPQKISVAALSILTELSARIREFGAIVPGPRWEFIEDIAGKLHAELMDSDQPNFLKSAGIQINSDPIDVNARILDIPNDTFSKFAGKLEMPYKDPVEYVVVDFHVPKSPNDEVVPNVQILMAKLYEQFKIYIANEHPLNYFQCDSSQAETDLDNIVNWYASSSRDFNFKILYLVVIDNDQTELHQTIKQKFDYSGMVNQVITVDVLRNIRPPSNRRDIRDASQDYVFNIALGINAKLGGVNSIPIRNLNELWDDYINDNELMMFIGIDTRLSNQKNKLGIVGLMTSNDQTGARYNASAIMTDGILKYCSDYSQILFEAFDSYVDANGRPAFPKNILVFRAGMSEYDVQKGEAILESKHILSMIYKYMEVKKLKGPMPKLTYIGYHQSHNVRFYDLAKTDLVRPLKNDTDLEGCKLNCEPGTVIDDEITNPNSFYFISHETFMGTTKPAKYTIVRDDICLKADNLLAIIYQLCRMNPQTNRPNKRPVPIGLASKLLERCIEVHPTLHTDLKVRERFYIHPDVQNRPFFI